MIRLFSPELDHASHISGLHGAALPLYIAECARLHPGLTLVITATSALAQRLAHEIEVLLDQDLALLEFPDWETLPYDPFSPHRDIVSQRIETLYKLPTLQQG